MASIGKTRANTADDIPVHVFIQVARIRARIGSGAYQQHYIVAIADHCTCVLDADLCCSATFNLTMVAIVEGAPMLARPA